MAESKARDEPRVRAALDRIVLDSLRAATLVLGSLLAFFAVADFFIYPAHQAQIALVDVLAAIGFFALHVLLRHDHVPARHANAMGAMLVLLVLADVFHDVWLIGDPEQTVYLMVSVIGAGAILLSPRWTLLVTAAIFGAWLVMASRYPAEEWTTMGFGLFAAGVLALLLQGMRLATHTRLETTRLREHETAQRLLQSEESYRSLVEDAPEGIIVHRDSEVLYANPAALRLYGAASLDELRRVHPNQLVHPHDLAKANEFVEQVRAKGRAPEPRQLRVVRLDGEVLHVELVGQRITFGGAPAEQTLLRDVTDRWRAEDERNLAAQRLAEVERLQEIERARTELLNAITHELRTPLTPIRVQLHLLKDAKSDEARSDRATKVIERNVERLGSLLDDLLEVARLQAGRLRLDRREIDLTVVVAQAAESYAEVARQNHVALVTDLEVGVRVHGDAQRLAQVLDNLLANAFKFTPEGGRIDVRLRRDDGHAIVRVSDTGIGLEPDMLTRLFQPFSQVQATGDQPKGTGLGLYVVRGFIEAHGGQVWAESEGRGKGATFAFRVPVEAEAGGEGRLAGEAEYDDAPAPASNEPASAGPASTEPAAEDAPMPQSVPRQRGT